jgi:cytidylate kinase
MALRNSVPVDDAAALARLACSIDFTLGGPGEGLVIDGIPAPDVLRSAEVDAAVSRVSLHPEVRSLMVERQRAMSRAGCVVMIGRDIGSVVLPAARVKLWIIASPEERARRRLAEGLPGSDGMSLREVTAQIVERDKVDSTRATSPLVKPDGSHDINTDTLSPDEAVQCALDFVRAATSDFGAQQAANEAGR